MKLFFLFFLLTGFLIEAYASSYCRQQDDGCQPYTVTGRACLEGEHCEELTSGPYKGYHLKSNIPFNDNRQGRIRPNMFTQAVLKDEIGKCLAKADINPPTPAECNLSNIETRQPFRLIDTRCDSKSVYCSYHTSGPYEGLLEKSNIMPSDARFAGLNPEVTSATQEKCIRDGKSICNVHGGARFDQIALNCNSSARYCRKITSGRYAGLIKRSSHKAPEENNPTWIAIPKVLKCRPQLAYMAKKLALGGPPTSANNPTENTDGLGSPSNTGDPDLMGQSGAGGGGKGPVIPSAENWPDLNLEQVDSGVLQRLKNFFVGLVRMLLGGGNTNSQQKTVAGAGGNTNPQQAPAVAGGGGNTNPQQAPAVAGGGNTNPQQAPAVAGGGGNTNPQYRTTQNIPNPDSQNTTGTCARTLQSQKKQLDRSLFAQGLGLNPLHSGHGPKYRKYISGYDEYAHIRLASHPGFSDEEAKSLPGSWFLRMKTISSVTNFEDFQDTFYGNFIGCDKLRGTNALKNMLMILGKDKNTPCEQLTCEEIKRGVIWSSGRNLIKEQPSYKEKKEFCDKLYGREWRPWPASGCVKVTRIHGSRTGVWRGGGGWILYKEWKAYDWSRKPSKSWKAATASLKKRGLKPPSEKASCIYERGVWYNNKCYRPFMYTMDFEPGAIDWRQDRLFDKTLIGWFRWPSPDLYRNKRLDSYKWFEPYIHPARARDIAEWRSNLQRLGVKME